MRTSHKLTRIVVTLFALAMLSLAAFAGDNPVDPGISDQKAGSILVFPYYTNVGQSDTRIQITNVGAGSAGNYARLHILLMDKGCQQLDYYACITPNGSLVEKASTFDPTNSGYIIVLVVDPDGKPDPARNWIIGNAFVNDGDYVGNYGAEAFWGNKNDSEFISSQYTDSKIDTATLTLKVPCEFAVEIQSPADAVQRVIVAGLTGNVNTATVSGSAQVGTGFAYSYNEQGGSFQKFLTGGCFSDALITTTIPRVPKTLVGLIPSSFAGHLRFSVTAGVGLLLTSNKSKSGWSGIRTLHKTKTTTTALTVPVFMPTC